MDDNNSHSDIYVVEEPGPSKSEVSLDGFTFVSFNPKEDRRARKKKEYIVRRHVTKRHVLKANLDSKRKDSPEGSSSAEERRYASKAVAARRSAARQQLPSGWISGITPHLLNPFDTMPGKPNAIIDRMLHFCVATQPPSLIPHSDINTWGRFSGSPWTAWDPKYDLENDELLLHSRVEGLALIYDHMTVGRPGKTHAYAAAQSMRMVRQRMESDDAVKDFWRYMATLSAAVGVANGAILAGDVRRAEAHLVYLKKWSEPIGGYLLPNLPIRIRRSFLYAEIRTKMLARKGLEFPEHVLIEDDCEEMPAFITSAADALEHETASRLPAGDSSLTSLMRNLHLYGLSSAHARLMDTHPAVSNVFWSLYYQACALSHRYLTPVGVPPSAEETIVSALAIAVPLFVRTASSRIYVDGAIAVFLAQLRAVLAAASPDPDPDTYPNPNSPPLPLSATTVTSTVAPASPPPSPHPSAPASASASPSAPPAANPDLPTSPESDPLHPWSTTSTLPLLAWILFTAAATADFDPRARRWFAGRLRPVLAALGLECEEEFAEVLRAFPWTEGFGAGAVGRVWGEAVGGRAPAMTATTTMMMPGGGWTAAVEGGVKVEEEESHSGGQGFIAYTPL